MKLWVKILRRADFTFLPINPLTPPRLRSAQIQGGYVIYMISISFEALKKASVKLCAPSVPLCVSS